MTNVHALIWSRTTTHHMHARGLAALRLQLIYIVQQTSMALACAKKNQPPVADVHAFARSAQLPLLPVALTEVLLHQILLLQLHLYDLVAMRKQQVGTAQPLRRTSRTSLQQAGPCLHSPPSSPAKLIGTSTGKENAFTANGLELDSKLVLPFQTKGGRSKQPAGHSPKRHDSRRAGDMRHFSSIAYFDITANLQKHRSAA